MAELNETPRADRLHIAFFGKTNAGKSSAINKIVGHDIALVSEVAGTTTDPVYKSMELLPLGPVVFIDTAGLDDETELGEARVKKTREVMDKADIAVIVVRSDDTNTSLEQRYIEEFKTRKTPVVVAYNKFGGTLENSLSGTDSVDINALTGEGIEDLKKHIVDNAEGFESFSLTGDIVSAGDVVVLVMPQDIQAPKGRLILPQVQVLRDLLDNGCEVVCVKTEGLLHMLAELKSPPSLVITDSQVFKYVNDSIDKSIRLTSFSMLMAKYKGDLNEFVRGARAIAKLKPGDKVLIAESCTHHAQKGDIAREKLPAWLENYAGGRLQFGGSSGHGFPDDIADYKLIVHCGGCMVNRKNMLSKIERAKQAEVPITNFGVAIAFLNNMLDRVV